MSNVIVTSEDRMDAADAKGLGISLEEYRDAKSLIEKRKLTISRRTIIALADEMRAYRTFYAN